MSQCPIESLTLLERAVVVRALAEGGNLHIVDADSKQVFAAHEICDVNKQGSIVTITVSKR